MISETTTPEPQYQLKVKAISHWGETPIIAGPDKFWYEIVVEQGTANRYIVAVLSNEEIMEIKLS